MRGDPHKPARIAYLCLEAPREGQASFVHTREIISGLRELGWTVDLYVPSYSGRWPRPSFVKRLVEYLHVQLLLIGRLHKYGLIYVRAHPAAWLLAFLCRLVGKPVVQEVNGPLLDTYIAYPQARPFRLLFDRLMQSQYRWATGLIAVTPGLGGWLRSEMGIKRPLIVIPNGANTQLFSPEAKTHIPLPADYVVFIGAQSPWHDIAVMLAAVEHPNWPDAISLLLVGDCSEHEAARDAAARSPHIHLLGRISYAHVAGVIARSRAALITIADPESRAATGVCPIKLFEAMACGVPVIATDLPYQAELVREIGAGLLVPPGNAAALAAAVAEMIKDRARAEDMGKRAADAIRTRHSWDLRAKETSAFLRSLGAGEPQAVP